MIRAGYSPSVRLFEAASCGTPIISDEWDGLSDFFAIDSEILVARSAKDTFTYLQITTFEDRQAIADRARQKVLKFHTAATRAAELVSYVQEYKTSSTRILRRAV